MSRRRLMRVPDSNLHTARAATVMSPSWDRRADAVFVFLMTVVSMVPYVWRLGFANDDWFYLGEFVNSEPRNVAGYLTSLWNHPAPALRRRPTLLVTEVVLYLLFGTSPLGYHVATAIGLAAVGVALYLLLRQCNLPRAVVLAIVLVYILMPNYSSIRVWASNFIYLVTYTAFFIGSYAWLRACEVGPTRRRWLVTAVVTLAIAAGGHESVLPLMLAVPVGLILFQRRLNLQASRRQIGVWFVVSAGLVLILGLYKTLFPTDLSPATTGTDLLRVAVAAFVPNLGTWGIGLPLAAHWALSRASPWYLALALLFMLVVYRYVRSAAKTGALTELPRAGFGPAGMLAASVSILCLSYTPFLGAISRLMFSSSSYGNRIAFGGALGVAGILVAGSWAAASCLRARVRGRLFAAIVAALCANGYLVNAVLASDHVAASEEAQRIIGRLRATLPSPEPGSTIILVNSCPYLGSAMVFARYDFGGALWFVYGDKSLRGDVGVGVTLEPEGLRLTTLDHSELYPYNRNLLVFDPKSSTAVAIPDRHAADRYFARNRLAWPAGCAVGSMDAAVPIFPLDRRFLRLMYPAFP
jgi:hypothetical protein